MATTVPPGAPEPAPMGVLARLVGVFFEPGKTFADIGRKPGWLPPVLLMMVMGLSFAWLMNQRVDWGAYIRTQAEKQERFAQLSEEQKQQALVPQAKYAPMFAYAGGLLGTPLTVLILAPLYMFGCNSLGAAGLRFNQAASVVAYGMMPSFAGGVLAMVSMGVRQYGDVTPENLLASHLGAYLPADSPRWMMIAGSSLDVFWIWCLALFIIGLSAAAGHKKLKTGTAAGVVLGFWLVWVVVKTGLAAAFS